VVAEHPQHGRSRRVLAFLLPGGNDELGCDVAEAEFLAAEVQGVLEHGDVGDGGAADRLAAGAGGLVALQGGQPRYAGNRQ
jgi:hypothetical protein